MELMDDLNIRNGEAALAAGVSFVTFSRWMNGHQPVPTIAVRFFELMRVIRHAERAAQHMWLTPGDHLRV